MTLSKAALVAVWVWAPLALLALLLQIDSDSWRWYAAWFLVLGAVWLKPYIWTPIERAIWNFVSNRKETAMELNSETVRKHGNIYMVLANFSWGALVVCLAFMAVLPPGRTFIVDGHPLALWLIPVACLLSFTTYELNHASSRWSTGNSRWWNNFISAVAFFSLLAMLIAIGFFHVNYPDWGEVDSVVNTARESFKTGDYDQLASVMRAVELTTINVLSLAVVVTMTIFAFWDWRVLNHKSMQGTSLRNVIELDNENRALTAQLATANAEKATLEATNASLERAADALRTQIAGMSAAAAIPAAPAAAPPAASPGSAASSASPAHVDAIIDLIIRPSIEPTRYLDASSGG